MSNPTVVHQAQRNASHPLQKDGQKPENFKDTFLIFWKCSQEQKEVFNCFLYLCTSMELDLFSSQVCNESEACNFTAVILLAAFMFSSSLLCSMPVGAKKM